MNTRALPGGTTRTRPSATNPVPRIELRARQALTNIREVLREGGIGEVSDYARLAGGCKSDDEIARMREQAAAVARIVIRTYFGASRAATSPGGTAWPPDGTLESLVEQNDGIELNLHKIRRRRHQLRRRPVSQVASSGGGRRPRGDSTTQS
jgi:hypothetical protein